MLLTLSASCLRTLLVPPAGAKRAEIDLTDLPRVAKDELGLSGINLSTDLLAGASRQRLEQIRERADKAGCACLLLVESDAQPIGSPSEGEGEKALVRLGKVMQAAHVLGCSSVALRVSGEDKPAAMELAIQRLKKVVDQADRLEVDVLLSPMAGLTAAPEKLTELIKKIGGFRIGTFPDFDTAAAQKDPVLYLRRLTPYAAVVNASTYELTLEDAASSKSKPAKKKAKAPPKEAIKPEGEEDPEAQAEKPAKGKGKAKSKAGEPKPPPDPKPKSDDEGDDADEDAELSLSDLLELMGPSEDEEAPAGPVPLHERYDLNRLVSAVHSVGYDKTLAIDYRGGGDVKMGVKMSRDALLAAIRSAELGETE